MYQWSQASTGFLQLEACSDCLSIFSVKKSVILCFLLKQGHSLSFFMYLLWSGFVSPSSSTSQRCHFGICPYPSPLLSLFGLICSLIFSSCLQPLMIYRTPFLIPPLSSIISQHAFQVVVLTSLPGPLVNLQVFVEVLYNQKSKGAGDVQFFILIFYNQAIYI